MYTDRFCFEFGKYYTLGNCFILCDDTCVILYVFSKIYKFTPAFTLCTYVRFFHVFSELLPIELLPIDMKTFCGPYLIDLFFFSFSS